MSREIVRKVNLVRPDEPLFKPKPILNPNFIPLEWETRLRENKGRVGKFMTPEEFLEAHQIPAGLDYTIKVHGQEEVLDWQRYTDNRKDRNADRRWTKSRRKYKSKQPTGQPKMLLPPWYLNICRYRTPEARQQEIAKGLEFSRDFKIKSEKVSNISNNQELTQIEKSPAPKISIPEYQVAKILQRLFHKPKNINSLNPVNIEVIEHFEFTYGMADSPYHLENYKSSVVAQMFSHLDCALIVTKNPSENNLPTNSSNNDNFPETIIYDIEINGKSHNSSRKTAWCKVRQKYLEITYKPLLSNPNKFGIKVLNFAWNPPKFLSNAYLQSPEEHLRYQNLETLKLNIYLWHRYIPSILDTLIRNDVRLQNFIDFTFLKLQQNHILEFTIQSYIDQLIQGIGTFHTSQTTQNPELYDFNTIDWFLPDLDTFVNEFFKICRRMNVRISNLNHCANISQFKKYIINQVNQAFPNDIL